MAERKRGTPGARVREAINGALGALGFNRGELRRNEYPSQRLSSPARDHALPIIVNL